jgi:PTS system cellobiose-specific IIA component
MNEEYNGYDKEIITTSMVIITQSGDARLEIKNAVSAMAAFDFSKAAECLKAAKEKLDKAHQCQTAIVQNDCADHIKTIPLLFTHAQDTLMTVVSEYNLASQMLNVFESLDHRISALEKK